MEKFKTKIIAEIGWNHMGDMTLAKKMINSAAINGADLCKFQTWSEENLKSGPWDNDGRREIYKKAQLSKDNHIELINFCKNNSVEFLTSVFNYNDVIFLKEIGLKKIKIPSHEINNVKLINLCIDNFDEIIVSTGASKWQEVTKISNTLSNSKVSLLHCVSSYPCDPAKVNLPRINSLREINQSVGYSGHLIGIDDAVASMFFNLKYVEKHFTIDNDLPGRDNKFAILPEDLHRLSKFRDDYFLMMINKGNDLQSCEEDTYNNYRGRWSKSE